MLRSFVAFLAAVLSSACATTGATFQSGVGDAFLDHPPFYAGRAVAGDSGTVAHAPVAYQRGATGSATFDPKGGAGTPMAAFLAELNASLDSLGATRRLTPGSLVRGTPPDVQFGCTTGPGGDCINGDRTEGMVNRSKAGTKLAVGRPSEDWVAWARTALDSTGADRMLVVTVEIGNYLPRQRNLGGAKEIELGTGYAVPLPWLTSLDTPVSVLQLTGALVGRDGKAIRIGAEGVLARRTNLTLSAIGAQALLTDGDVDQARAARRDDLPGKPLVWQVALRNLVGQLVGRGPRQSP
jgi:hypothetical protein